MTSREPPRLGSEHRRLRHLACPPVQVEAVRRTVSTFEPFESVIACTRVRQGLLNLLLNCGLGGLQPDALVLPLIAPTAAASGALEIDAEAASDFTGAVHDVLQLRRHLLVTANMQPRAPHSFWATLDEPLGERVDVWIFGRLPAISDQRFSQVNAALSLAAQSGWLAQRAARAHTACCAKLHRRRTHKSSEHESNGRAVGGFR